MTLDLEVLAEQIRETFGTDRDPDRWAATVVLNVLVPRSLPASARMTPSGHEEALVRYLSRCDLMNLRAMLDVKPEHVRAFAIYAYERGGTERLLALVTGGPPPLASLVQRAHEAYGLARLAGEDLDGRFAADDVQAARDLPAWRTVSECAALVPRLAGALDRALAGGRWLP